MQYIVIGIVVVISLSLIALLMSDRGKAFKEFFGFFITGLDSGFSPSQILFLGKIGRNAQLEDMTQLFWSIQVLDRCIAEVVIRAKETGTENDASTQEILSKLYSYRTKIELEEVQKKHGLDSTRDMIVNQKIRVLLRGTGVFTSRVVRNGPRSLVIDFPSGNTVSATSIDWINRPVSVYFWRHDDAGYVFDTKVVPDPTSNGKAVLHLAHSFNLVRSQKRKSIRVKCSIYAQMYLLTPEQSFDNSLEPEPGMKCLVEDISEDGAMIVIGGKAAKGIRIKLQLMVYDVLVVMTGTVRGVEYNKDTHQSRLHLEAVDVNPRMKNAILTFVYNVLPQSEKEELDAIRLSEEDGLEEAESVEGNEDKKKKATIDEIATVTDIPDFIANK